MQFLTGNAPAELKLSHRLSPDGTPVQLKIGQTATYEGGYPDTMALLLSNTSFGLSGSEIEYVVMSACNGEQSAELESGNPAPQTVLDNWQSQPISVTNIAVNPGAEMTVRLYGIQAPPDIPLEHAIRKEVPRFQTIGGVIPSERVIVQVGNPTDLSQFILIANGQAYQGWLNVPIGKHFPGDTLTPLTAINLQINQAQGQRFLLLNASPSQLTTLKVSLLDLCQVTEGQSGE